MKDYISSMKSSLDCKAEVEECLEVDINVAEVATSEASMFSKAVKKVKEQLVEAAEQAAREKKENVPHEEVNNGN